jgi:glycine cleavage system transcriptional repressor
MPHVAVTAIGLDRPGIVAAVTGVLVERRCNLEDSRMTILRGHFAMMLVVATPDGVVPAVLEQELVAATTPLGLVVTVRSIDDESPAGASGEEWSVAVYGADRPGIVHGVAAALAGKGVNIVDLSTRVIGADTRPVYAMFLDVRLPAGVSGSDVESTLGALAGELGVECSVHPSDADIL